MTLPASGPISFAGICAEFGLTVATAIFPTHFYGKGGAPASGPLSFHDFYGRSGAATVSISPTESTTSSSSVSGNSSHTANVTGGTPTSYNWVAIDGGLVVSGQGTATASLRGTDGITYTYRCDVVVNGTTYSATCIRNHTDSSGGGLL